MSVVGRTQFFNPGGSAQREKDPGRIQSAAAARVPAHAAPPAPPAVNWPKPITPAEQTSLAFFNQMAFLLQFCLPPHPSEVDLRKQFARIGILPGKPFDPSSFSPDVQAALKAGIDDGQKAIDASRAATGGKTDTLFGTREYLKNNFLARATGTSDGHRRQFAR